MQEALELCVRIDELAHAAYRDMAARCEDPAVALVLNGLADDEAAHVGWWRELLAAWEAGLLPDVFSGSGDVLDTLRGIVAELEAPDTAATRPISGREALTRSVRIEFFALDPVFGDMLDLAEPAVSHARHEAYNAHVGRLVGALEQVLPPEDPGRFLAHVLRRVQRENRILSRFATRDTLTGLANRRALTGHLNQWTAWASRYGRPVALLLLDVDHFKRVNDRYGHLAGDELLTGVAGSMLVTVRSSDLVARFGGDEFAVIAPELDVEQAVALAGRLLAAVREAGAASSGTAPARVTASVGVAVLCDAAGSPARPIDHLLSAADSSLYEAKRAGRDRVGEPVRIGGGPVAPDAEADDQA